MTTANESNEHRAARVIDRQISRLTPGAVIPKKTAWLIAAAVHRDADSELRRFAETGIIEHHQAARLELYYTAKEEPDFTRWADALRDYITMDERQHEAEQQCNSHSNDQEAER